jgi:hypothetical protein
MAGTGFSSSSRQRRRKHVLDLVEEDQGPGPAPQQTLAEPERAEAPVAFDGVPVLVLHVHLEELGAKLAGGDPRELGLAHARSPMKENVLQVPDKAQGRLLPLPHQAHLPQARSRPERRRKRQHLCLRGRELQGS